MTQERLSDISIMVDNIYPTFGGVIALVNLPSNDGTLELLQKIKGRGNVITQNWTPHHGFLMNHLLFYGGIKDGEWCVYLDSPESMTNEFINALPYLLEDFHRNNVGAVYWDNRPYIFRYNPYLEFHNAVHWSLSGIRGKLITIPDKDKYIVNRRLLNKAVSWCLNPIKYWFCYPKGNECDAMYGKYGQHIINKHESIRQNFRSYCETVLKISLNSLDDLISYMIKIRDKTATPSDYFIDVLEKEFRMSELFQLKVLGFDFMTTMHPRYKWSFKDYLKYGDGWHNKDYDGTVLRYDKGNFNE